VSVFFAALVAIASHFILSMVLSKLQRQLFQFGKPHLCFVYLRYTLNAMCRLIFRELHVFRTQKRLRLSSEMLLLPALLLPLLPRMSKQQPRLSEQQYVAFSTIPQTSFFVLVYRADVFAG
jgi:hypothetical protein